MTLGAVGTALVFGGYVLTPFLTSAANMAALSAGATNGSVFTSFYGLLYNDVSGNFDVTGLPGRMWDGAGYSWNQDIIYLAQALTLLRLVRNSFQHCKLRGMPLFSPKV